MQGMRQERREELVEVVVVGRRGKEEVPNQRMRGGRGKNILRTEAVSRRSWGRRGRANTHAKRFEVQWPLSLCAGSQPAQNTASLAGILG